MNKFGRPNLRMVINKKVTTSYTLDVHTRDLIAAIAKNMHLSRSILVDMIIKRYLEEHEEIRYFADGEE